MSNDYDNTNSGALFKNDKKETENHPDYKGSINVEGVEYWMSSWIKTSKAGAKYMSMSIQKKDAPKPAAKPSQQRNVQGAQGGAFDDMDDDIPFAHHGACGAWRVI